ncbi:MAG: sialate O-acetylesterase [bacterium]
MRINLLVLFLFIITATAFADVKVGSPFGDNMVLQQGINVPVWGTAAPSDEVTVTFGLQSVKTVADANGKWTLQLKPLTASAVPDKMMITSGKTTLTFSNVLVGEVWVCSGQSNMEWALGMLPKTVQNYADADEGLVRMFTVEKGRANMPQDFCRGLWMIYSAKTSGSFSAVGYYFARELSNALHVPVGMLNSSYGGTRAEPWTSLDGMKASPIFHNRAVQFEKAAQLWATDKVEFTKEQERVKADYPAKRAEWYKLLDAKDPGLKEKWMSPSTKTKYWREIDLPSTKENNPLTDMVGSLWFRKDVEIPKSWVGKSIQLRMCPIDEVDDTYVNGTQIGRTWFETTEFWKLPRNYTIPAELVKSTKINLTVRVLNLYYGLGFFGAPESMSLSLKDNSDGNAVSIAGKWLYTDGMPITFKDMPAQPLNGQPGNAANDPSVLYNYMIHPLVPYAIRGAIWYQGESNADSPTEYNELLGTVIKSWRSAWKEGDFPFAIVQLANFMAPQKLAVENGSWAEVREAQTKTLSLPNTTMAVIIDIGEAESIHPRNKLDVGKRLALGVLANTYKQNIPLYSGPVYKSMRVKGNTVILKFNFSDGLKCKGDKLNSFAIAGADKVFYSPQATIDKDTVVVSSDQVNKPVAVRYGWANNPPCNLYNSADLPAAPFRTDDWVSYQVAK